GQRKSAVRGCPRLRRSAAPSPWSVPASRVRSRRRSQSRRTTALCLLPSRYPLVTQYSDLLLRRTHDLSLAQQGDRSAAAVLYRRLTHDNHQRAAPPGLLVRLGDLRRDRVGLPGADLLNELDVLPGVQAGQSRRQRHRRLDGSPAQAQAKCGRGDHVGVAGGTRSLGIQVQRVEVANRFGKLADVAGGHAKSADGDLFADKAGVQFNHSGLLVYPSEMSITHGAY